jgi:hypothetical protein
MKIKSDAWGCLLPEPRLSLVGPRSKLDCRSTNEEVMGNKLNQGIKANRTTDDTPSYGKSKGSKTLFPQRRVRRHDTRERKDQPGGETKKVFMRRG